MARRTAASSERVPVFEAREELGRALDVREQERDVPLRQLPLRLQLGADESDRDDAVWRAERPQEPRPRLVPCGLILEDDLIEPRERVARMWGVVDRQAAPSLRIDVGKRAVGQAGALFRVERHQVMIANDLGRRSAPAA